MKKTGQSNVIQIGTVKFDTSGQQIASPDEKVKLPIDGNVSNTKQPMRIEDLILSIDDDDHAYYFPKLT